MKNDIIYKIPSHYNIQDLQSLNISLYVYKSDDPRFFTVDSLVVEFNIRLNRNYPLTKETQLVLSYAHAISPSTQYPLNISKGLIYPITSRNRLYKEYY